jgi:hypothetical protein
VISKFYLGNLIFPRKPYGSGISRVCGRYRGLAFPRPHLLIALNEILFRFKEISIESGEIPIARDRLFKRHDRLWITQDQLLIEVDGAAGRADENLRGVDEKSVSRDGTSMNCDADFIELAQQFIPGDEIVTACGHGPSGADRIFMARHREPSRRDKRP